MHKEDVSPAADSWIRDLVVAAFQHYPGIDFFGPHGPEYRQQLREAVLNTVIEVEFLDGYPKPVTIGRRQMLDGRVDYYIEKVLDGLVN